MTFFLASALLIASVSASFVQAADCPFARGAAPKTREVVFDGIDALRKTNSRMAVTREIYRKGGLVQNLITKSLLQHMANLGVSFAQEQIGLTDLLTNVSEDGRNIVVTELTFPSAPDLGVVYRVQIGYLEADAARSATPEAYSERIAAYYFKRMSVLKPSSKDARGVNPSPQFVQPTEELFLVGSMLDSQVKSCFL